MTTTQSVVGSLADVRFYGPLDPYYYTVDNRPLEDLDDNVRIVAGATDSSAGNANRTALAAAATAYSLLGYGDLIQGDVYRQAQGAYGGSFNVNGLQMDFEYGFLIAKENRGGTPTFYEPVMAVHDAVTSVVPQAGRGAIIQVKRRASTEDDRISSGVSPIQVAEVSIKQGTGPGIFPLPDAGAVTLMKIDVPAGASTIDIYNDIEMVNMKTIEELKNPVGNAKISYVEHKVNAPSGATSVSLTGSSINTNKIGSIEVFVQGVNQFDWSYDGASNQVILAAPISEAAEIRIRQLNMTI